MTNTWHDRTFEQKECIGCGATFTPTVGFQKRCKPDCGREKTCVVCGSTFTPHRAKARTQVACSPSCGRKLQYASLAPKACRACGEMFTPTGSNARYCSEVCRLGSGTCHTCGKAFTKVKNTAGSFCSRECWDESFAPIGTKRVNDDGYVVVKIRSGAGKDRRWQLEHRHVMEQVLGRKLLPGENPHHKDGNRQNNSPENLELWRTKQPKGVRASDYHCPGCRCHEIE